VARSLAILCLKRRTQKGGKVAKMPGICPRCDKNVYFAEEKQALGKSWHKLCFVCANCRKMLDSGRVTEHDGEMFCGACYRKNFGPKGYGFGGGSGTLSMDDGKGYTTAGQKVDHQAAAYVAPKKAPLTESNSNSIESDVVDNGGTNGTASSSVAGKPAPIVKKVAPSSTASRPRWGGAEICPRCNKSVFIAELMRGAGRAWHKTCFTCNNCNKRLDSSIITEREGEIYCRPCYGRNFGPKGFGYGIGAGMMKPEQMQPENKMAS